MVEDHRSDDDDHRSDGKAENGNDTGDKSTGVRAGNDGSTGVSENSINAGAVKHSSNKGFVPSDDSD